MGHVSSSRTNILLYAGAGSSPASVHHAYTALRLSLSTTLDIIRIDAHTLLCEPWEPKTAMLVIPGGKDTPLHRVLGPKGAERIRQFVTLGGKYLGLCSGAYYASSKIMFETHDPNLSIQEQRHLGFFPGSAVGAVFPGFNYDSESGALAVGLDFSPTHVGVPPKSKVMAYYNGGCYFDLASITPSYGIGVDPVAWYADRSQKFPSIQPLVAIVRCKVGLGLAVLSGAHIEYSGTLLKDHPNRKLVHDLVSDDDARKNVFEWILKECLQLEICSTAMSTSLIDTHMYFISVGENALVDALRSIPPDHPADSSWTLHDQEDSFTFHSKASPCDIMAPDSNKDRLHWHVLLLDHSHQQPPAECTYFKLAAYVNFLLEKRNCHKYVPWLVGSHVLYIRVIPSTQSIVDKNPEFMDLVPSGTVIVGYHQTQGRGRGTLNSWISPAGCLQFSIILKIQLEQSSGNGSNKECSIPTPALVHIQYLMAMAVAQAKCLRSVNIRIKWPNDLYARHPEGNDELVKIGGILVTSSIVERTRCSVVVGCGLNVSNALPTTCINSIFRANGEPEVTMEQVLADVLVAYDLIWLEFVSAKGMSLALRTKYLETWIHSGQVVTVSSDVAHQSNGVGRQSRQVRITGIDDCGYLVTQDQDNGEVVLVQPNGNSFDMLHGLIYRKA